MDLARLLLLIRRDNGHLLAAKQASKMGSNRPIAPRTLLFYLFIPSMYPSIRLLHLL